jgi:hypothetical protein
MEEQKGVPQTTRNPETGELEIGKPESQYTISSLTSDMDDEENKKES